MRQIELVVAQCAGEGLTPWSSRIAPTLIFLIQLVRLDAHLVNNVVEVFIQHVKITHGRIINLLKG